MRELERFWPARRMDIQVSIITAVIVTLSCLCVFAVHYVNTYSDMIHTLHERVLSIYGYMDNTLNKRAFYELRNSVNMDTELYHSERQIFENVRQVSGVRYLYTATQNEDGTFIYLIDGLPLDAEDFRRPGDPIEHETIPELERAMAGESVMPGDIKDTGWGKIFIAYLPIHDNGGCEVIGVVGIEFEAESQYNTYWNLRLLTPVIILAACLISVFFAVTFFRRISNPSYRDMSNTDQLTQLKNRNAYNIDAKNLFAQRNTDGVGIMLLDLNNLKKVNDALGHSQGDRYLQIVSGVLSQAVHGKGIAYRIGGDEFAVLVPRTSHKEMSAQEERIHVLYAADKPDWPVETAVAVGWYVCTQGDDLPHAYKQADRIMYEQKRAYHESEEHNRRNPTEDA